MLARLQAFWNSLSFPGVFFGALLFTASLSPSLVPRTYVVQGVLSGLALAFGYGFGVGLTNLWAYLQLKRPGPSLDFILKLSTGLFAVVTACLSLWKNTEWQNSVRSLMQLPPVDTTHPISMGLIALAIFVVVLVVARMFVLLGRFFTKRLRIVAPPRLAYLVGMALAAVLFWSAAEGVLFRALLHAADSSYRAMDELIETSDGPPADYAKDGQPLISWDDLGRMGRTFVAGGPAAADIAAFRGAPALDPIRVYVGLKAADTPEARAKLALQELIRRGGFERSTLVVITPTGTGWVDEQAVDPLDYLLGGDVASVAVQYSYLASWLSLLVEPDYGSTTSRALFQEIYRHWKALPRDSRPKLYLFGLSLGALSTEQASELFEVIGDPYQGVLLAGPPFPSRIWHSMTERRNAGSPAWLPSVGDGSFVRFTAQKDALAIPGATWGPMRTVYLQYASDPITFFEPSSFYREPEWMKAPRGPDVSPQLSWYPVVTFLQLGLDLAMATTTPIGHGHVYAAAHYIDAWREVLALEDWSVHDLERLKQKFRTPAQ